MGWIDYAANGMDPQRCQLTTPLSEAAGVAGEKGAGAITDGIQNDLGGGGSIKAKVVKAIVETVAGELVQQGTEKIDELANKEIKQN